MGRDTTWEALLDFTTQGCIPHSRLQWLWSLFSIYSEQGVFSSQLKHVYSSHCLQLNIHLIRMAVWLSRVCDDQQIPTSCIEVRTPCSMFIPLIVFQIIPVILYFRSFQSFDRVRENLLKKIWLLPQGLWRRHGHRGRGILFEMHPNRRGLNWRLSLLAQ